MEISKNNIRKHIALILLGASALVLTTNANAIEFSTEELKTVGPEQAYWVTNVTCDDGSDAGEIRRKTDGNEWCATLINGFCGATKAAAGEKVCGSEYTSAVAEIKQQAEANKREAEARQRAAAERARVEQQRREAQARELAARQRAEEQKRNNQIQIDEQLLKIEQEKLSLRRQELELQQRAIEIREALEALDKT